MDVNGLRPHKKRRAKFLNLCPGSLPACASLPPSHRHQRRVRPPRCPFLGGACPSMAVPTTWYRIVVSAPLLAACGALHHSPVSTATTAAPLVCRAHSSVQAHPACLGGRPLGCLWTFAIVVWLVGAAVHTLVCARVRRWPFLAPPFPTTPFFPHRELLARCAGPTVIGHGPITGCAWACAPQWHPPSPPTPFPRPTGSPPAHCQARATLHSVCLPAVSMWPEQCAAVAGWQRRAHAGSSDRALVAQVLPTVPPRSHPCMAAAQE